LKSSKRTRTVLDIAFCTYTFCFLHTDLHEAQKFVEQLDYDYAAVAADAAAAQQRSAAADLLWYDYGGGGGGGSGGGGAGSPATTVLIAGDKRGGSPQSSNGGLWFGPRLGRRKRRGGVVQPVDGNTVGPAVSQETIALGLTAAAGQAVVSDLINNAPWVLVPIIENTREYNDRVARSISVMATEHIPVADTSHLPIVY
jgi:hypothetical protein